MKNTQTMKNIPNVNIPIKQSVFHTKLFRVVSLGLMIAFFHFGTAFAQSWELVWSDEFETDTLDMSKWSYQFGTGASEGLISWGNNELQYYTDREENIYIEDNMLHIRALEEQYVNRNYTSSRIRTIDKGDWKYGKFEARAKLPEGQGLWPAIWMMPTENVYGTWPRSGEIDIMELVGHEPDVVYGTVHYGSSVSNHAFRTGSYTLNEGTFSDDFHIFTITWEPERIRWFIDDQLYFLTTPSHLAPENWPFDQYFHFILNVAVGGNWPGNPDSTTEFPQEMVVDYIRVYQDQDAEYTSIVEPNVLPERVALYQNYPNPFNPSTSISFDLPEANHVKVEVFDVMGRRVAVPAEGNFSAGRHTITFNTGDLSSGTYIYRLITNSFQLSRTMILAK